METTMNLLQTATTSQPPPSSWPDLIKWILSTPKMLVLVLAIIVVACLLVIVAAAILRVRGYDVFAGLLAKLGIKAVPKALNISGKWKYRCTASKDDQWGGRAVIELRVTPRVVTWKLAGHRTWEKKGGTTTTLDPSLYWETDWGTITDRNTIRFGYTVTADRGTIHGYSHGVIKSVEGVPAAIDGKFFQLPPFEPKHGLLEFRRMVNDADLGW